MTDKEIIKALECCHITCGCSECAYVDCPEDCVETMKLDALYLINRQQAVIERYEEDIERLRTAFIQEVTDRDDAKAEAIKEYIEKCVLAFCCGRGDDRVECYICENDFLEIMNEMRGADNG